MEEKLPKEKYTEIKHQYALDKTIGSGGFAKVKLATHIVTGEKVAIKIMDKNLLKDDLPRINKEFLALKTLHHPNICKLLQFLETDTYVYLVMEYCSGGELFDHIVEREKLTEAESRIFFRQIVNAISYCHSQGFAHRDLKPENILLDQDQNLKIVDFGLCVRPDTGEYLETSCGSPNYAAPELLKGVKYIGPQVDIWSLGVLLYGLLCGYLPFDHEVTSKLYQKIMAGCYEEPDFLSPESKTLIREMLQTDPIRRISTAALCAHSWINKGYDNCLGDVSKDYSALNFDKECLLYMSHFMRQSINQVWKDLCQQKYDYNYATYQLLYLRKQRALPLKLIRRSARISLAEKMICESVQNQIETLKHVETYTVSSKSRKRCRSDDDSVDDVPAKMVTSRNRTPIASPPPKRRTSDQNRTPLSARKVFGHLRSMFTPSSSSKGYPGTPKEQPYGPAVLTDKQLCNVSCTSSTDPEHVLKLLHLALIEKGVICTVKGYAIRGKLKKANKLDKNCKLFFELEICLIGRQSDIPKQSVVGIRRKRLKGDAWIYKSICEDILAIASI